MNLLIDLSSTWGTAIWRTSWQAGLVVLAVWAVCRFVPSIPPRFQAWLWRLAVLKFMVVLLWASPLEVPLLSPAKPTGIASTGQPLSTSNPAVGIAVVEQQPARFFTSLLIPFFVWVVVVGWQMGRLLTAWRDASRLRKSCRLSGDRNLLDQLIPLSQSTGLRVPPLLLETDGHGSPLLVGIHRPAIIFPSATLDRLDDSERGMVLGHELAHLRRGDLFWGLLAALIRAVFFFHPLAWLCERQLRLTQEIAADELALALQKQEPVRYATLLVSCVSKIGPGRLLPTMAVGMAGSQQSLKQRIFAMRFMKPRARSTVLAYDVALTMIAVVGIVPWSLVAAEIPAKVERMTTTGRGQFVSFKDGTLTLKSNSGSLLVWNKIAENTPTIQYDHDAKMFKPVTVAAMTQVKTGMWIQVIINKGNTTIRIGERKSQTVGTFVSFKNDRLLVLGKNLGESYVKKYGNNVHFNKFRDEVPVYESIDGGEYKLIGNANKVLGNVKEGTILTIHGEGDDNITLIQIGVPKKK